ncbi:MAG: pyridoxal phosphate-dependent aminotransferase [Clostridia bacterium]|nr:pyridoxal phosphate-dependent aminotransferase [Clostridia bacterium]
MYDFDTVIDRHGTASVKWDMAPKSIKEKGYTPLTIADMEFKVAPEILKGIGETLKHGIFGYTYADESYFNAVAGFMKRRRGYDVERDWLIVTNGVVSALGLCVRAFTSPGDGVIIQPPVYPPFMSAIASNGRNIIENPLILSDGRYSIDFDDLESKCAREDVKMILLCSPHNPVGRVWSYDELKTLGEICKHHDVLVISDEIHGELILPGFKHTTFATIPGMADNCVVCTAMSKTFNLAGMCCSNIFISNPDIREKLANVMRIEGAGAMPALSRSAAIAAMTEGDAWLDELLSYIEGNFAYLYEFIEKRLPMIRCIRAEGTYLAWLDLRALSLSDEALERLMIDKGGLALDEGYIFGTGGSGFERLNLAVPRSILVDSLERFEIAVLSVV